MRKISVWLLGSLYVVAGVNHFVSPEGYEKMIPAVFDKPGMINLLAGVVEIVLGLLVFFRRTRYAACIGIVIMLLAFIPVHIRMIGTGICFGEFCAPKWVLWLRLLVLQPLLIYWAWRCRHLKV